MVNLLRTDFVTPLSHWAMYWRDATWLADPLRKVVELLVSNTLTREVELPGGASLAKPWTWRHCSDQELAALRLSWSSLLQTAPANLRTEADWMRVADGIDTPKAVRLHPNNLKSKLTAVVLGRDRRGPSVYARRHFEFESKQVIHAYLAFTEELRGAGFGVKFFEAALPLYEELGVRTVRLTAGLSVGGAIWGKFGFRPIDEREWRKVARAVRRNLPTISEDARKVYERLYGATLDEAVDAILKVTEPTALWALHDMDPLKALRRLPGLEYGLSGALLRGARWKGILNFGDPTADERLRDYLNSKAPKKS